MSTEGARERRRRLVAASLEAAAALPAKAGDVPRLPAPGDLFALSATAGLPVEWALLARHPGSGLFLAVPADTHPFLGDFDLAAAVEPRPAPLHLRCGAAAWLPAGALEGGQPAGRLAEKDREEALRAVEEARAAGPGESGISPELADWHRDVIAPALGRFKAAVPLPARRRVVPSAWAAAALLLLSLSLGGWILEQNRRLAGLAAERAQAEEEFRYEHESQARREAERRREGAARERRLREQVTALERRPRGPLEPQAGLPLAFPPPVETMRGEPRPYSLPAGAPALVVVLQVPEEERGSDCRVELTSLKGGRLLWKSGELRDVGPELVLTLPRSMIPAGSYRLSLYRAGRAERLAAYDLRLSG